LVVIKVVFDGVTTNFDPLTFCGDYIIWYWYWTFCKDLTRAVHAVEFLACLLSWSRNPCLPFRAITGLIVVLTGGLPVIPVLSLVKPVHTYALFL
jgi:hypothetical protein